jgi:hypothetical protein
MLPVVQGSSIVRSAEAAQQAHHVMIMLCRRRAVAQDPVEQIGVGAIEQRFEPIELSIIQFIDGLFCERTEDEIALLRSPMPAAKQHSLASDVQICTL